MPRPWPGSGMVCSPEPGRGGVGSAEPVNDQGQLRDAIRGYELVIGVTLLVQPQSLGTVAVAGWLVIWPVTLRW